MEIYFRTSRTIFTLSQRSKWKRWISLQMSSPRILRKELWISITCRSKRRRDTPMATRHASEESTESPHVCPGRGILSPDTSGKRACTTSYTTVYMGKTLRLRSYVTVLHGSVIRAFFSRIVYGAIRVDTELVYGVVYSCIRSVYVMYTERLRPDYARKCLISYRIRSISMLYFH